MRELEARAERLEPAANDVFDTQPARAREALQVIERTGRALTELRRLFGVVGLRDRSKRYDFYLVGRGVNRRSGRAFTGLATWKVKLVRGSYAYGSDRSKRRLRVG
jgi:hypothetical protein